MEFTNLLNKSVFNKSSYAAAIGSTKKNGTNGYATVRIRPRFKRLFSSDEDPVIIGVLNTNEGNFSFNVDSEWEDLGKIAGSIVPSSVQNSYGVINNIANVAGVASLGAAYSSKKIYKQSGFLEIKIPMMVVDWNGTGQPINTVKLLSYYCLPRYVGGVEELKKMIQSAENTILNAAKKLQTSDSIAEKVSGNIVEGVVNFTAGAANLAIDKVSTFFKEVVPSTNSNLFGEMDDLITLRSSPVPVEVSIGNFFKHPDMVITNVNFSFSKEMTRSGPLYVNIGLDLSSRMVMVDLNDTGLCQPSDDSRYFVGNLESGSNATGF